MKKILLIGDSIRAGYARCVKAAFDGIAEVVVPEDSGRFAAYVYRSLPDYKRIYGSDFDLIHWNAGLWDCLIMHDGMNFSDIEVYKSYMERICVSMKQLFPSAKAVFAKSTYVLEWQYSPTNLRRKNADIEAYNAAAVEITERHGMATNDLYALTSTLPESYHSDMTHYYTKEATEVISKQVIASIENALGIKANELDYGKLFEEMTEVHGI